MVVNFLMCELMDNEVLLLLKGLNFCLILRDFDRYKLCRDINDFIRCIRFKEYFYGGDNVEGDFLNVFVFRNKFMWCFEWGRELVIEVYV